MLDVKPHEFIRYGLGCLEMMANYGDHCALETRDRMRIMVCSMLLSTTTISFHMLNVKLISKLLYISIFF